MTKDELEKAYWLQRIDCNCNNCGFMLRNIEEWRKWMEWHKALEEADFSRRKAKAIAEAEAIRDKDMRRGMLYKANKMRFLFEKTGLSNYGTCLKFNKPVSFLPDTCQIETQHCFVHRNDYVYEEK